MKGDKAGLGDRILWRLAKLVPARMASMVYYQWSHTPEGRRWLEGQAAITEQLCAAEEQLVQKCPSCEKECELAGCGDAAVQARDALAVRLGRLHRAVHSL